MSSLVKSISLRATYESDLAGLHKDMAGIKSIRKRLEKHPIRIPVMLDLSGIKSQATKAAQEYRKALQSSMANIRPGDGVMSKGGVIIPPGAMQGMAKFTAASGAMFKTISVDGGKAVTTFSQIEKGLQSIERVSKKKRSSSIIDTRPIENFKAAIADVNKQNAEALGKAQGSKSGVAAALRKQYDEIEAVMASKKHSKLSDTPAYIAAQKQQGSLLKSISSAEGQEKSQSQDRALKQRLDGATREHRNAMLKLDDEEKIARAVKKRSAREAELNRILAARRNISSRTSATLDGIHGEASRAGKHSIADKANTANNKQQDQLAASHRKMGHAARQSGHNIDFHTGSLLKNAATFTRWFVPAQLVMGTFRAIGAGARSAVAAERTFKTLNAVFRGTREESELLARQTLQLAAANGRGAQEAAEAAVSWARLGLTRTQVLMAMETSLRAANVAEISTADATKYLSAQYKAFNQTLTDIPANLDYINSLSNKLNVTPENIMQGIARTATVAKQAGVEFEELAAIIAVVTDVTGRPGEETGNAMKFILTRIRRPETLDSIKDEFDLDLRKPNGDAKKMTDIFGELAALYPSLNRLEKARINDLVAGSRQTERYAVIVDNWTEILLAQAGAALDANSAQRENAEILSSVDASLQQVSTSWTAFMHALGETGAFAVVAENLKGLAYGLESVSRLTDHEYRPSGKKKEAKAFELSDSAAEFVEDSFMDEVGKEQFGILFGDKYKVDEKKIDLAISKIQAMMEKGGPTFGDKFNAWTGKGTRLTGMSEQEMLQMKTELTVAKTGGGTSTMADAASKLAMAVNEGQGNADGLNALSAAADKMSKDMLKEGVDPNKMLKQFDLLAERMELLPEGLVGVAEARLNIRPLMVDGKREEASAALADVSKRGASARDTKVAETEALRTKSLGEVNAKVKSLQAHLLNLNESMSTADAVLEQQEYQDAIAKTTDRLKEAEEAQKALATRTTLRDLEAISGAEMMRLDEYFKDLTLAQETIGTAISGFANTGMPGVDMKIKAGGALMQRDIARKGLAMTEDENQAYQDSVKPELEFYKYDEEKIAAIREELTLRNNVTAKMREELRIIEEATEQVERRLELERQAAAITEAGADGRAHTRNVIGSFAIGENQGQRLANQTRGALSLASDISRDPFRAGDGDTVRNARELGQLTEALSQSKQGLVSMEQRMYQATEDRANLEIEITENAKKQREEATKRLALASREDQLRAAAARAVLKNRGTDGFSMQEFQFFGQETKGALSNLMPDKVKGLDDTERDNNRSRNKLDQEIAGLANSLKPLTDTFLELQRFSELTAGWLAEGLRPEAKSGNEVADLDKPVTTVNLNLGDVVMNFDLLPHLSKITDTLKGHIDSRLDTELNGLRRLLRNPFAPNNTPTLSAF